MALRLTVEVIRLPVVVGLHVRPVAVQTMKRPDGYGVLPYDLREALLPPGNHLT